MAAFQGEFCAVNIEVAFRAKPNGRYIEVAALQRAGIARVYCTCIIHYDTMCFITYCRSTVDLKAAKGSNFKSKKRYA